MNEYVKQLKERAAREVEEVIALCIEATGLPRETVVASAKKVTAEEASKMRIKYNGVPEYFLEDGTEERILVAQYSAEYAASL